MNLDRIDSGIEKGVRWFMGSGIINNNRGSRNIAGSINSYYIPSEGRYAYAYSEITGYGLTFLTYLDRKLGDGQYIDRALSSFEWLVDQAFNVEIGGCYCRYDLENGIFEPRRICSFDNGMILNGLCSLYRITGRDDILAFAVSIGEFLVTRMVGEDGSVRARYIFEEKRPLIESEMDKWSSQKGSFQAKIAIGLVNLYQLTEDDRYLDAAERICSWSLRFQRDNGRFVTNRFDNSTHLHPHSYSCEGLLTVGSVLENNRFVEGALRGIEWGMKNKNETGGFPRNHKDGEFTRSERNDINAQMLRLQILGEGKGLEVRDEDLQRTVERMIFFQRDSKDPREDGAFIYGYGDLGNEMSNPNSWVTMFNVQALIMYRDRIQRTGILDPLLIV